MCFVEIETKVATCCCCPCHSLDSVEYVRRSSPVAKSSEVAIDECVQQFCGELHKYVFCTCKRTSTNSCGHFERLNLPVLLRQHCRLLHLSGGCDRGHFWCTRRGRASWHSLLHDCRRFSSFRIRWKQKRSPSVEPDALVDFADLAWGCIDTCTTRDHTSLQARLYLAVPGDFGTGACLVGQRRAL